MCALPILIEVGVGRTHYDDAGDRWIVEHGVPRADLGAGFGREPFGRRCVLIGDERELETSIRGGVAGVQRAHPACADLADPNRRPVARHTHPHAPETPKSEEHTSELQSLMRISYAVFCL